MAPSIHNHTPWPHVVFERGDASGRSYWVAAIQGSFSLPRDGVLESLDEQQPVQLVDSFWEDPARSSVRRPGVIGYRKRKSDLTVNAAARSRTRKSTWPVRFQLGSVDSTLVVRGPHHWVHEEGAWRRTEPEPCQSVALVYENAFGGGQQVGDEFVEERRNPLGTGFIPEGTEDTSPLRAPQVVGLDEPEHEPGDRHAPRGWGAIPSYFAPRTHHVGTCDAQWKARRWPRPPDDFDDAFYQSAHPDLVYPGHLRGDETFQLEGVTVSGETIVGRLPGWVVFLVVHLQGGRSGLYPAFLDHVHLDVLHPEPSEHRGYLTWRSVLPRGDAIEALELGMTDLTHLEQSSA